MNTNILNIKAEFFSLILLLILFFYNSKEKEQKGYGILKAMYVFAFVSSCLTIACFYTDALKAPSLITNSLYFLYYISLFSYALFWLCYLIKCFDLANIKVLSSVEKNGLFKFFTVSFFAVLISFLPCFVFSKAYLSIGFGMCVFFLVLQLEHLHRKSVIDNLTNMPNRYGLEEEIEEQLRQYRKDKTDSFFVIACDMDDFKSINDTWGHAEGDRALKLISAVLTNVAERNNAIAFRNGGDEFVIITDKADGDEANIICDEVERELEKLHFRDDFAIKISMGVAYYDGKHSVSELLNKADGFLYDVKRKHKSI